jgi:hypothetical protein
MGCGASANAKPQPAGQGESPSRAGRSASIISRRAPFEYTSITSDPAIRGEIVDIFNSLDADGNGTLEKDELREFITCYDGRSFDEHQFDAFFSTLDVDGSASIDPDEFCKYVAEQACMYADDASLEEAKKSVSVVLQDFREILQVYYKKDPTAEAPAAS